MSRREIVGVRIKLASTERIRELSSGEVKKPETINYRTLRPEKDGLFCERIFGPTRSYECACGKYKRSGPKYKGILCDRCGVEVTDNRVRRERMGHIELAAPVVHIWYLRGIPSRLSLLLGTATKDLEKVVYFAPIRKRKPVFKVVMEGRRTDLARRGDLIDASEERIHSHYDPKFKAEEAFRVFQVDDVPVDEGDLVSASQVSRFKADYGDEFFKVEPAFRVELGESDGPGEILSAGEIEERGGAEAIPGIKRALVGNQEAFIVTAVAHLPFQKNDVLAVSEVQLYNQKYPGRFQTQPETVTIEDPCYLVIDGGESPFARGDIILEREQHLCAAYDREFSAGIGAEGVQQLLNKLDLDEMAASLREEISETTGQKKRKLIKRLQVVEDFRKSASKPQWMILEVLPVIPPDLRPMVQLEGGRFATSDLNDLYRRVINRNNRLRKLQELRAPEIIIRNEKRMLQESVDALIDNGRMGKAVLGAGNRTLKSLSDLLRGKKGRFRQNLLGKRVDYSGRSVIVIGPKLRIYQCGLPKQMALELFKPFVMHKLVERGLAPNVKSARRIIERGRDEIWAILEEIIKDHPVMLNRAPTLHRLGIQAFEPVLMEGKAIRLPPLVCTAFNADFDGDQMAVHVPLSLEAQAEARILMLSANNLLSPASGRPVVTPTQDIVLGIFYLTAALPGKKGEGMAFDSVEDVLAAIDHGVVHPNTKVRMKWDGRWIDTSPGRALFNSVLPEALRYINKQIGKKDLGTLIDKAYDQVGQAAIVDMLDAVKLLGYQWSTRSGISFGLDCAVIPPSKKTTVDETMKQEEELSAQYGMGILTEEEYLRQKEILWSEAARQIADDIVANMEQSNPLRMMIDSGARGSKNQVAQMAGIRGLMADPSGRIIDYPIVANFRDGLNMLEYFISTHGARKGLADTALRTAKSGYLTRRLVDVAQDLIITEEDCGTDKGTRICALVQDGKTVVMLSDRIAGRTALVDIEDPSTGEALVQGGDEITQAIASRIENAGIEAVWVRSPMTCGLRNGICQKCYGRDLATRKTVAIGEAVGVVAAQSIGEPGTQLTMRTFHTGGVRLTGEDITQGLPRIEQLFEVRRPKKVAQLVEADGRILEIREMEGKRKVIIGKGEDEGEKVVCTVPASQNLLVEEGQLVKKGQTLTEGYIDPQQLLEVEGLEAVQKYLVDGIQEVYFSQGVSINNKHIEVILRKVAPVNRVRITEEGDSSFVANELAWKDDLDQELDRIRKENDRCIDEAIEFLSGKILRETEGGGIENLSSLKGRELEPDTIERFLAPGSTMREITVEDGSGQTRVILGEAAFRREMEGLELIVPVSLGENGGDIQPTDTLGLQDLLSITRGKPQTLCVRDTDTLASLEKSAYLAEDVLSEGVVVVSRDRALTPDAQDRLKKAGASAVKVWRTLSRHNIDDALNHHLIEKYFSRPIKQVINAQGNQVNDIGRIVDGRVVRGLVEGQIAAVEIEGETREIVTREKLLGHVLTEIAYGKVLLEPVSDGKGNLLADAGTDISGEVIDRLVKGQFQELVVRPKSGSMETKRLIQRVSFVRRMREEPQFRSVVHGVTKAALATDSFMSAASFQQTAQILAQAAVRGDVDNLKGLKENVIIGHLIPAGTGSENYRRLEMQETC